MFVLFQVVTNQTQDLAQVLLSGLSCPVVPHFLPYVEVSVKLQVVQVEKKGVPQSLIKQLRVLEQRGCENHEK